MAKARKSNTGAASRPTSSTASAAKSARAGSSALFMILTLLVAVFISGQILRGVDYLYPMWYELLKIDQTIAQYGPQNRQGKLQFETTTKNERARLFAAMVDAVHDDGRGLQALSYHDAGGRSIDSLLTDAEIVHLNDVAQLLSAVRKVGWISLGAWIVIVTWLRWQQQNLPTLPKLLGGTVIGAAIVAVALMVIGPTKVFYQLHVWIFPPGHQWFFYYQDSLMSMMMKAPELFGPIALTWVALSLLLVMALVIATRILVGNGSPRS